MSIKSHDKAGANWCSIAKWVTPLGLFVASMFGYTGTRVLCYLCCAEKNSVHQFEILSQTTPDASKFDTVLFEQKIAQIALEQGADGADLICVAFKCRDNVGAYIFLKARSQPAYKLYKLAQHEMWVQTMSYRPGASSEGNMLKLNEDGTHECAPVLITADGTIYDLSKTDRPRPNFRQRDDVTR